MTITCARCSLSLSLSLIKAYRNRSGVCKVDQNCDSSEEVKVAGAGLACRGIRLFSI